MLQTVNTRLRVLRGDSRCVLCKQAEEPHCVKEIDVKPSDAKCIRCVATKKKCALPWPSVRGRAKPQDKDILDLKLEEKVAQQAQSLAQKRILLEDVKAAREEKDKVQKELDDLEAIIEERKVKATIDGAAQIDAFRARSEADKRWAEAMLCNFQSQEALRAAKADKPPLAEALEAKLNKVTDMEVKLEQLGKKEVQAEKNVQAMRELKTRFDVVSGLTPDSSIDLC